VNLEPKIARQLAARTISEMIMDLDFKDGRIQELEAELEAAQQQIKELKEEPCVKSDCKCSD